LARCAAHLAMSTGKAALLKDKVNIAREETIPNIWVGTMVTLTDL